MMATTNPKRARKAAQHRYYEKNRDRLIERAKLRYQESKLLKQSTPPEPQSDPILESPQSLPRSTKPKSHFFSWIQRLTGKRDPSK